MSYRRTYTEHVAYSGSKTATYPPSKHGGVVTVHYSGVVPVTVNIDVDTQPFDQSVDKTRDSLTMVAGAVAATEAAQVAEINRDADAIAQTTIRGFFRMLASEFSAKVSEFGSNMKSCVGLLNEEALQVDRIHQQMESDYSAIKARYLRIFTELDRELDMRIRELDRPAFFVCKSAVNEVIVAPFKAAAAKALTVPTEIDSTLLKLMCARTKQSVSSSLGTLSDVCDYITDYDRAVELMMSSDDTEGSIYMPVVYAEQQDLDTTTSRFVTYGGGSTELRDDVRSRVISTVATAPEEAWAQLDTDDKQQIDSEFMSLLDEYRTSHEGNEQNRDRVCQKILELYRQDQPTCVYAANE